jgi:succinate dehydrogenase / fumarate reductase cytochrome b subunit
MQRALSLTRTTVGQKALVAITGAILFGFVIGHLAGNMLLFAGPETYNGYAAGLKANLPLLWGVRLVLLTSVVVHVVVTLQLARRNATARAVGYQKPRQDMVTNYAARTMVLTGPLVFLFILFHLAHYTAPGLSLGGTFDVENVYGNVVQSFRVWWVSAIYIFANAMLGLHLYHGGWSFLQSLGANDPRYNVWRKRGAIALALLVAGGNVSIPVLVLSGVGVQSPTAIEAPAHTDSAE